MLVIRDTKVGCGTISDPIELLYNHLKQISCPSLDDTVLILGDISPQLDSHIRSTFAGFKKLIRFDTQEPTRYIWNPEGTSTWTNEIISELSAYDHIITSDPYSHYWRLAYYPHLFPSASISFLPSAYEHYSQTASALPLAERPYQLSYAGRLDVIRNQGSYHAELLHQLAERVSCVISFTQNDPLVTHYNLSNVDKLHAIGRSIVSLCHNSSYVLNGRIGRWNRLLYSWYNRGLKGHPSFKNIIHTAERYIKPDTHGTQLPSNIGSNVPQFRYRMFEAAFSRTLLLVRDDSAYTDHYFERNTEYIPYTPESLSSTLDQIFDDPAAYQHIADRAHARALTNYTTSAFIQHLNDVLYT